ncbi:hypothetical protein CAEBREN_20321 [Caenorhabditis brenneri]|uniref:BTB domain-containing protein n=1 Tax=Caenorhabditis brenneri TaxID=135651 RepID=G0MUW9_CAEBE|nr:hypothetical protein CAEBREN_20321 [Caenorhabditis brenneri]
MLNLERRLDEDVVTKDDGTRRMKFDNPDPALHDVVLVVEGRKFYCSKIPLAKHSPFFYNLFFADGEKRNLTGEYEIKDPSTQKNFCSFLETCYGINAITDANVFGVLTLAKLWEAPIVEDRCWDWLVGSKSQMTDKKKFQIALKCDWEKLKLHVLSKAYTPEQLDSIVPHRLEDLDHHTMTMILEKSLKIGGIWPPRPERQASPPPHLFEAEVVQRQRLMGQHRFDQMERGIPLRDDESNSEFSTDDEGGPEDDSDD